MKKFLTGLVLGVVIVPSLVFAASTIDTKLVNRLKGRILLQTQSHGEAWYLSPVDGKRYYMKDGATAYEMMRKFGTGIANKDLDKIPVGTLPSEPINNTPPEQSQNNQNTTGYIRKNIGEYIQMATLKYKVNTVSEVQSITGILGTKFARTGTKFVVVNLDITNTTNAGFGFWYSSGFVLLDNQSRQYTPYSETIGYINNYLNLRDLSPSISENGILVYEIPLDSVTYDLATTHADTNETYLVKLK